MIKETIVYTDFNGNEHTEDFYFNLSKPELIELEVEVEGGMAKFLDDVIKAEDSKELVSYFKRIVLLSYGKKSDDGKRFVKTPDLREEFEQHAAYPELFMKLAQDDKAAARFINGIVPQDVAEDQDKPQTPPPAPAPEPPELPTHLR